MSEDGLAWLDLLAVDRIGAMRAFLTAWYPESVPGAVAPVVTGVPAALAALYAIAAGRPEVLGTQNEVLVPDKLRTDPAEGLVVFAGENQGNFWWMFEPDEDDPTVWRVPSGGTPEAEGEPLSGFLVQFCLFEALSGTLTAGSSMTPPEQARQVTSVLREVPLAPWSWPAEQTRFFVAPDLVVYAGTFDDTVELVAGARTPAAFAPLKATDVPWEVFGE
ncbi:hypothetical protein [Actinophytocola sp.]|uniref:hypothetical protein n=1 Tax=Actinophytocola sp. TaxID=1872138 RepID=UPI002ED133AA